MTLENDVFNHLVSLEQKLYQFEVRSSLTKISPFLSSNYYEYAASGKVLSKEDVLNRLPSEDDKTKIETHSFKILHFSSDTALLTYISKKINADGTSLQYLKSSVWKNENGQWQIIFHQGTIKN